MFRAIEKTRVSEDAVQKILELIRTNNFGPGHQLASERQLAQQLGVGRNSIREAVRKLETMGLVEVRQGLGTFIKDPTSETIQTVLVPYLLRDRKTLYRLYELREIIEVEAAGRAATRATPEQVVSMRQWLEAMEKCSARGDLKGVMEADIEFHHQIIVATDNSLLVDLVDGIADLLRDLRWASLSLPARLEHTTAGHQAVLAGIEAHDAQAARQAMFEHLDSVRKLVKEFGPWNQEQPAASPAELTVPASEQSDR